jgi:16S rRNA (adenine1518-N6/adenine1519-N6)-dimethyltransferase
MSEMPIAKKGLGQHWLTDQAALQAICDAGEITQQDTVLEIGPGTGTLTRLLVQHAKQVIAVEFDSKLASDLPNKVKAKNLMVEQHDILTYDLNNLPPDYKIIANIPYYLTSNLIRVLSETTNRAALVVLLVQKEVAQRVAAKPGDMSLLSVSAQFYWEVSLSRVVPAKLFTPAPKIDSQVLILKRRPQPLFPGIDTKHFFQLVKAGFSARRKMLHGSLSGGLRMNKEKTIMLLQAAGIDSSLRPQELSLQDWYSIYRTVENTWQLSSKSNI